MNERTPLQWPARIPRTPKHQQKRAQFGKKGDNGHGYQSSKPLTIQQAVDRLMREIRGYSKVGHNWRIKPDDVIISTNLRVRVDGFPYSSQPEPQDNGVAVYFTLDNKDYCLPCDKWDRIADNIAAIAAHLGAMRGQERWGVGQVQDIYTGYAQLPESIIVPHYRQWWEILDIDMHASWEAIKEAYRKKVKATHPDSGGTTEAFQELQRAFNDAKTDHNK
jgi:hypothetical protein